MPGALEMMSIFITGEERVYRGFCARTADEILHRTLFHLGRYTKPYLEHSMKVGRRVD